MAGLMRFTKFALRNLFSKPVTKNYPEQPRTYAERTRGSIRNDIEQCIFCGMCQRKCPSGAITVDRNARTWSIERMGCVQCENCVLNCPKKCLYMENQYTEPDFTKTVDTLQGPPPPPPKPKFTPEQIEAMKAAAAAKKEAKSEESKN